MLSNFHTSFLYISHSSVGTFSLCIMTGYMQMTGYSSVIFSLTVKSI